LKERSISGPIGIFDSGFGGLSVFKTIQKHLPECDYLYLGDNARTPYGNRSYDAVLRFTTEGVEFLQKKGCPLVIIACNTASARALRSIQMGWLKDVQKKDPGLRVLGVIRPTTEKFATMSAGSAGGKVGVWGTPGTIRSDSFALEAKKYSPSVRLVQVSCPLLVALVEAGELSGPGVEHFVQKYWEHTCEMAGGADQLNALVLACTHYPLLLPAIRKCVPSRVQIFTQGELVAESLQDYLQRHQEMSRRISRGGGARFFTTDSCEFFDHLAEVFMGQPVASEKAELGL